MERSEVVKILEILYDTFHDYPFTRENIFTVFFEVFNKLSSISNTRNFNALISLNLIKMTSFSNFKLTDIAIKMLKDADVILPSDYLKSLETNEEPIKGVEVELSDYIPDKTVIVEVPKEYVPDENPRGD